MRTTRLAGCLLAAAWVSACSTGMGGGGDGALIPFDAELRDAGTRADRFVPTREDAGPVPDGCSIEMCNGVDDDCDGQVDEGCPCLPGERAACFRGRLAQRGVGACRDGTMACDDGFEFGTWGACEGDVLPSAEVCDPDEIDEDCDGAVNEGCECTGSEPIPCGSAVGACGQGLQECVDGRRGECIGATEPRPEVCNGIDDDCDGTVDEGVVRACGSDVGECRMGAQRCIDGAFEACVGGRAPTAEICDGLDNDCDGTVDQGLMRACGSTVGECRPGMQVCADGSWGTCSGETTPGVESCDGLDNDCDGMIDEGVTRACGSSTGECRPGTQTCSAGVFGECMGGVGPGLETCDGVLDEDCDGAVDEGCGCTSGTTRPCGTDVGACQRGSQTCDASGNWGTCMGAIGPTPEECNRIDDDCDGSVDEGGVCPTAPPVVMCPGSMTADVLSTVSLIGSGSDPDGGTVTFEWTVTSRPVGSVSNPSSPTRASTNFYLDASGSYTLRLCVTDDEGEVACCSTTITSNAPGQINVQLAWSTEYGDVDLHLLNRTRSHPNGWWTVDDCHFANRTPDWGPAGAAGNPTLDIDDTNGYGPENISITSSPVAGTYTVGVHYYCNRSLGSGATPGSGPTTGVVRVYCGGALIATYTGIALNSTDDWVTVAEVDYPSCVGRSRNVRTNGTSLLPSGATAPRHCEIPCSTDSDCPRGERCVRAGGGGPPRNICWL